MLATWLAALTFLIPLQCLAVVKLADRLSLRDAGALALGESAETAGRYAQAA